MKPILRAVAAVTATAALMAGCSSQGTPERDATAPSSRERTDLGIPRSAPLDGPKPGSFTEINLPSGRTYVLAVPEDYDPAKKWPLLMSFHGWKETSWNNFKYTDFRHAEAISVYPQGKNGAWAPAPYADTKGSEDIAFVEDILDTVRATYTIDDERIYATGMSNGGGFVAYLACQMPGTFKSIASISAAYYEAIHNNCADQPVGRLDLHGTNDPVVKYYGGKRHGTRYNSVVDVLAHDEQRNRCSSRIRTERLANSALLQTWSGCEEPLQHIRIGGGKHVWPGGAYDKDATVGKGFATDKILDFFGIPGRPEGTRDT